MSSSTTIEYRRVGRRFKLISVPVSQTSTPVGGEVPDTEILPHQDPDTLDQSLVPTILTDLYRGVPYYRRVFLELSHPFTRSKGRKNTFMTLRKYLSSLPGTFRKGVTSGRVIV